MKKRMLKRIIKTNRDKGQGRLIGNISCKRKREVDPNLEKRKDI